MGKTHMDELAWSLQGENYHYGTPRNGRALGRIPGGSSSGERERGFAKVGGFSGWDGYGGIRARAGVVLRRLLDTNDA